MATNPAGADVSFNAYLGRFAIVYLLTLVAFGAISNILLYAFEFALPYPVSFATLIVAAALPASAFVRDARRVPARREKAIFAFLATLVSMAISLVVSIAVMMAIHASVKRRMPDAGEIVFGLGESLHVRELGLAVTALALLVAAALSALVIYAFAGIFAKQALKRRR